MSRAVYEGKISVWRRLAIYIGRFFLWLFLTILVLILGLYLFLYLINKGPSPHFRDLFVASVMESSAGGILARIYLTDEEIEAIRANNRTEEIAEITDVSLIDFDASNPESASEGEETDASSEGEEVGYVYDDPDGDGIEIHEVHGETYSGMMMIVYDPSRVVVSSIPSYTHGYMGWTIQQHVENNGAVAGINGGKYEDNNGLGSGAWPEGVVITHGRCTNGNDGRTYGVYGFNEDNIFIVGNMTAASALNMGIRDAVTFGPALVVNGNAASYQGEGGGLNPRTAIGQRDDGAVLMLVIEGRKSSSLGATMADLIDIMLEYGAVNAANMDGGMSSTMFYEGEIIVDNATVRDTRRIPTAFVVMPLETD